MEGLEAGNRSSQVITHSPGTISDQTKEITIPSPALPPQAVQDSHAPNGIIWGTVAAALPDPSSRARLGQWLLHHWRPSRVEQVQVKMKDFKAETGRGWRPSPLGWPLLL